MRFFHFKFQILTYTLMMKKNDHSKFQISSSFYHFFFICFYFYHLNDSILKYMFFFIISLEAKEKQKTNKNNSVPFLSSLILPISKFEFSNV